MSQQQQKSYGLRDKPKKTVEGEEWESSHQNRNTKLRKIKEENKPNKPNNSNFAGKKAASGNDHPGRVHPFPTKKAVDASAEKEVCRSCKKLFITKELPMHEALCIKLGPTESFFKLVRPAENGLTRNTSVETTKIALPDSQPENLEAMSESRVSPQKSFASAVRGENQPNGDVDFLISQETLPNTKPRNKQKTGAPKTNKSTEEQKPKTRKIRSVPVQTNPTPHQQSDLHNQNNSEPENEALPSLVTKK